MNDITSWCSETRGCVTETLTLDGTTVVLKWSTSSYIHKEVDTLNKEASTFWHATLECVVNYELFKIIVNMIIRAVLLLPCSCLKVVGDREIIKQ